MSKKERAGFEPAELFGSLVFRTSALDLLIINFFAPPRIFRSSPNKLLLKKQGQTVEGGFPVPY